MSAHFPHGSASQGTNASSAPGGQQSWPDIFGLSQQSQPLQRTDTVSSHGQYNSGPQGITAGWNNGAGQAFLGSSQPVYNGLSANTSTSVNDNHTTTTNPNIGPASSDPVLHFFNTMPTPQDDPVRHQAWTELVRLKTRALELQIAEAKAKEKEAEAELMRLKELYRSRGGSNLFGPVDTAQQQQQQQQPLQQHQTQQQHSGQTYAAASSNVPSGPFGQAGVQSAHPFNMSTGSLQTPIQNSMLQLNLPDHSQSHSQPPTSMTTFDLEAMMQNNNLDNLFSWLPDFGDSSHAQNSLVGQTQPGGGVDPNDLLVSPDPYNPFYTAQGQALSTPMSVKPNLLSPPPARRSRTPEDDDPPSSKRVKRTEKKIAVEHTSSCQVCHKLLARAIIRAPKSHIPDKVSIDFTCTDCRAVPQTLPLNEIPAAANGSGIGTVDTRKRLRIAMEAEDEERKEVEGRRAFCDVCQRVFGSGLIAGGPTEGQERESLAHMTEMICASCDAKYARCTDCGGGGGGRMGIGKWRMKQIFQPGRKTCSMSHTRLGDRPREIGVHVTPTDFTPEQLKEVLSRCKQLWNEKTLARLAVPEMLEIDLPPHLMNPIRNYADVEDIVTQNWPNRESMIRAEGADPARFKRLLGLVWAHSKSRRGTRTVDIEEEWHKTAEGEDDDDMSTVLDNVKRTNLVIPGGSELIGMWGGEWDLKHGALLVSTFIPFEGTDGEDSTAVSVGEMITKVQTMRQAMNQERKADAAKQGVEPDLVPQCEHLWVVSGGAMPLVRERIADFLIRRRSFVHVDEYLTRHPDFINALNARPVGLHPDILRVSPHAAESRPPPLVLVRWLGKDFDAQKIREIKQAEFGGKAKLKKKTKGK